MSKSTAEGKRKRGGLFSRLRRDIAGNTLMIGGAAIIPMIGIIGGGVDASRAYLVKNRLQQACDAGALAARRELQGGTIVNGNVPANVQTTANNFFRANFAQGLMNTNTESFTVTDGGANRINGAASVRLPMTLMTVFGFDDIPISATCSAELNLPSIDIVLVLDMSGSMRPPRGQSRGRIDDLQDAVFAFYDRIMAVRPAGSTVRIGFVPYNGAVNVGRVLFDANPNFIADEWTYQSRRAVERVIAANNRNGSWRGPIPQSISEASRFQASHTWDERQSSSDATCNAMDGTYTDGNYTLVIWDDDWRSNHYPSNNNGRKGACIANLAFTNHRSFSEFDHVYEPRTLSTAQFKRFQNVSTDTGNNGTNITSRWNGCIEERATVPERNFNPIPAGALDLDIDLIPTADPNTQWKPMWPQVTYDRRQRAPVTRVHGESQFNLRGFNCPVPAFRLQEYNRNGTNRHPDFVTRVNSLVPAGGTMHDIGMLWAARMISPLGIFGSDNLDASRRHIIFMTDGDMGADPSNMTVYGNYDMDGRFMGFRNGGSWSEDETIPVNNARLTAICRQVGVMNVTVWTITFALTGTQLTNAQPAINCATDPRDASQGNGGTWFNTSTGPQLRAAFESIADRVAELRLVE